MIQRDARLKRLYLSMPEARFSAVKADGRLSRRGEELAWEVPARGGAIRYRVEVTHQRSDKGYDALVTEKWALFRGDRVFPRARAVHRSGARARGELLLVLPAGWAALTPYLPDTAGRLTFAHPEKRYSRPVGWMLTGQLGARMDVIGPTTVRVAAPRGHDVQRVPMLALMRSVLPLLKEEFSVLPSYLLVVSAADPMWRGGLSASNSIYLHAERPVIGENGTSTLVHELVHMLAPVPAAPEHDWIDEGVAEYLGLLLLRQANAISPERFDHALDIFRRQGAAVSDIVTRSSRGPVNARAVTVFREVDLELQRRTAGKSDIFDLVRLLMKQREPIDVGRLRRLAAELAGGHALQALAPTRLPGNL